MSKNRNKVNEYLQIIENLGKFKTDGKGKPVKLVIQALKLLGEIRLSSFEEVEKVERMSFPGNVKTLPDVTATTVFNPDDENITLN